METFAVHQLLKLDSELGRLLSPDRAASARRAIPVRALSLQPGTWAPEAFCDPGAAANVGLLVIRGVIVRELSLRGSRSSELLGPGDLIRTWQAGEASALLNPSVRWRALQPATVALLDRQSVEALRRYPEVMLVVLDRLNARAQRLAVTQAISQLTGVDTRVEALLWHLADRWGRVGPDGVIVPVDLSHQLIGTLIGAQRPTVSTALARLAHADRVLRRADGTWVLRGAPPEAGDAPGPLSERAGSIEDLLAA